MSLVLDDLTTCLVAAGIPLPALTTTEKEGQTLVYWEAYLKHYVENVRKELESRVEAARQANMAAPAGSDELITPTEGLESEPTDVVFGGTDG